jgi:hypothetical protein
MKTQTQIEITKETPWLYEHGRLKECGYARRMVFQYRRNAVKAHPFALKEWDFYQLASGKWILQLTIGHVYYIASYSATMFNLQTGERVGVSRMSPLPLRSMPMDENPEKPHVLEGGAKDWTLRYEIDTGQRRLRLKGRDKQAGDIDISLDLENDPKNEKMVILTPFPKKRQFYLNYKENYWGIKGHARIGGVSVDFGPESTAIMDWGRGVWPFRQEWYWGNGTGFADGHRIGFNIGWGFGDTSRATENMFFVDGKAYKLDEVRLEKKANDYMASWHFTDDNGLFDLVMTPFYDNYSEMKVAVINNHCHQVYGLFNGTVRLPDGKTIKVENLQAFCEHAQNQW